MLSACLKMEKRCSKGAKQIKVLSGGGELEADMYYVIKCKSYGPVGWISRAGCGPDRGRISWSRFLALSLIPWKVTVNVSKSSVTIPDVPPLPTCTTL